MHQIKEDWDKALFAACDAYFELGKIEGHLGKQMADRSPEGRLAQLRASGASDKVRKLLKQAYGARETPAEGEEKV